MDEEVRTFNPTEAEAHAETVPSWVESPEDREAWASRSDLELVPELFRSWHDDPDVHPHILLENGQPRAYGEVWTDEAEAEAEVAHVVVAPAMRGRGIGRRFMGLLAKRAIGSASTRYGCGAAN
jgi:GNAT superfamily N-acetyltransferase